MRFFARAEEALALLSDSSERWRPRRSRVAVRLSLTPSVALPWLFSRLPKIEGSDIHPDLMIEQRLTDFSEGTDLAIRCGKGQWPGARGRPLWHEQSFPIAAPWVAERLGQARDAKSLLAQPILHDSNVEG